MTMKPRVRVIGAATDAGTSVRGSAQGPNALIEAGLLIKLELQGWEVEVDDAEGPLPSDVITNGYRNLAEVIEWKTSIDSKVSLALTDGALPLLLGGDHSVAIGSIAAVKRFCSIDARSIKIIWLDAHADANTAETSPTANLHGMPVACLLGHGPEELRSNTAPSDWMLIGPRSIDPGERTFLTSAGISVISTKQLHQLGPMLAIGPALTDRSHLHLSIDLDFLDPTIAPGVSVPEPKGGNKSELLSCLDAAVATGRVGSIDLVELNPVIDQRTTELGVSLIERTFKKLFTFRSN